MRDQCIGVLTSSETSTWLNPEHPERHSHGRISDIGHMANPLGKGNRVALGHCRKVYLHCELPSKQSSSISAS